MTVVSPDDLGSVSDSEGVPDVRLNILPVKLNAAVTDAAYYFPRDLDRFDALKELEREVGGFHALASSDRIYLWLKPGHTAPPGLDLSLASSIATTALPLDVIAHAVREAAVDFMTSPEHGFERLHGRFFDPVKLFRRKRNLASQNAAFSNRAGVYPYLMIQGIVLESDEAQVGLVIDAGLVNRLDIPLQELQNAKIEIAGLRVAWAHAAYCGCPAPQGRGTAGVVTSHALPSTVTVEQPDGTPATFSARCLLPRPKPADVERFYSSMDGAQAARKIGDAVASFHDPKRQWQMVEAAQTLLNGMSVFASTVADVGVPLTPTASGPGVSLLPPVPDPVLNFRYGAAELGTNAATSLTKYGPYDGQTTRNDKVKAIVLCPTSFVQSGRRLRGALLNGTGRVLGFQARYSLSSFEVELREFPEATADGYRKAAGEASAQNPDIVYVTTSQTDKAAARGRNRYLATKAVLANAGIASQAVTVETLQQPDNSFQWTLDQLHLQSYTKLGNIAYALHDPDGTRELVLGIGRTDVLNSGTQKRRQLFGAACAFRQDGDFLFAGSTTPVVPQDEYESQLRELIKSFVARYEQAEGARPDRIVIHLFKRTGRREVNAINDALADSGILWALLHVNRDTPLWIVADSAGQIDSAPVGSVVHLGDRDRLLMTGQARVSRRRNLHPIRLTLDKSSTFTDMDRLTEQIFGFTAVTMRSYGKTFEPSTILYGRLLADKVASLMPYGFQPDRSAAIGDRPWFL